VDTLATVPDDPPAADPDRALDPAPPDPRPPAELPAAGAEGDAAVVDDAPQAASTIAAHVSAGAMIHRLRVIDNDRRTLARLGSSVMGPDAVALESARAEMIRRGFVGS
jgi:hypothetical protein